MPKSAEQMHATVLVFNQANTLSFAAAVDPMRAANRHAPRDLFTWQFATPGPADVTLTSGVTIPAAPVHRVTSSDLLIVVASFDLNRQTTPDLCASLRRLSGLGGLIAGIDGGPWVMAQAGLLNGVAATSHWEDLDDFARQFPDVLTRDARFVVSGRRLTSGGATPAIDMMLHLIGTRFGAGLADRVAASLIFEAGQAPTRPQGRHGMGLRHSDQTARAHDIMQENLEDTKPIHQIARAVGLSPRGLQMVFQRHLQVTPQAHYLALRLAEAERLVRHTTLPLSDIGLRTGFGSQSSFARAFHRAFGTSARSCRATAALSNRAWDGRDAPQKSRPELPR